ncbi:anhydro-N-acetylmuramic acid kinase AnmK [Alkaliphilus peptidifermentans]|uniref:Anhydro-N-acetylmuramic acid kinase n=1 Tax=Alkaliphilus peptidifermentans DSM 18978 TaxID=1120976 RepID=A0A1G5KP85_9FIRM|nr:anhydro-N-acetylmuramic acid kinase AnmK [Alkaliphilus peptidifermentans]SCZ02011.1 anhydro-N-acetylmuramic acid kinase [Alkaliphilus peptidifermentans DSM 18978]
MKKLLDLVNKDKKLVIGLMSGTSIDGIDCALVLIEDVGLNSKVTLKGFKNYAIDLDTKNEILECCSIETSNVEKICKLNFKVGNILADAVIQLCKDMKISLWDIDLIGSHGQTIYHIPQNSTLQIGEAAVISEKTGIPVVSDFRVGDVAAGGHGAPLVPYTEFILYRHEEKTRMLQNIGGIGNVTLLPKGSVIDEIKAFDTGPGNMIIDYLIYELTGGAMKYDTDGRIAAKGSVDKLLLSELMKHPYMEYKPPKSTGRETFGRDYSKALLSNCLARGMTMEDIVATATAFTVESIIYHYETYIYPYYHVDEIIVGGGGSYNNTIMKMLREKCKGISVFTQEDMGLSSDAKEAIAFAILANEAVHGNNNNIPGVTGARNPVVMGKFNI